MYICVCFPLFKSVLVFTHYVSKLLFFKHFFLFFHLPYAMAKTCTKPCFIWTRWIWKTIFSLTSQDQYFYTTANEMSQIIVPCFPVHISHC